MYVPILKSKQSEGLAISELNDDVIEVICPLVDLVAPSTEAQKKNPSAHVERNIASLVRYYSRLKEVMLDSSELSADIRTPDGTHPLLAGVVALVGAGLKVVPVTGLYRDDAHLAAVRTLLQLGLAHQVCIRLDPYDFETPTDTADQLHEIRDRFFADIPMRVVYDFRGVFGVDIAQAVQQFCALDGKLDHKNEYMTVVAGCGLPDSIADAVPVRSSDYIARAELQLWRQSRQHCADQRRVVFGDYATVTPDYVELDWALIYKMIGPKIVYAQSSDWFVTRGGSFEHHPDGRAQYYDLAKAVVALPEYPGPRFSFGDAFIHDRANGIGSPGAPAQWVKVAVNRHVTLTARNSAR